MARLIVLRQLQSLGQWSVGQDGVQAIELVAALSSRWGLTTSARARYRIRLCTYGCARKLYIK